MLKQCRMYVQIKRRDIMGFWDGVALGIMAGGVFGIVFAGILQAERCADCQADIIKSLQGKIKGA